MQIREIWAPEYKAPNNTGQPGKGPWVPFRNNGTKGPGKYHSIILELLDFL